MSEHWTFPRDIALVTFDDIEESTFSWPPLTLAQQPVRAMGAAISALLSGNDAGPQRLRDGVDHSPVMLVRK